MAIVGLIQFLKMITKSFFPMIFSIDVVPAVPMHGFSLLKSHMQFSWPCIQLHGGSVGAQFPILTLFNEFLMLKH